MKAYYIDVLTIGAMESLSAFVKQQADELEGLAQFVPHSREAIEQKVIDAAKLAWFHPGRQNVIDEPLPDDVILATTKELLTTEVFAYDVATHTEIPIFRRDGELRIVTDFVDILSYSIATDANDNVDGVTEYDWEEAI